MHRLLLAVVAVVVFLLSYNAFIRNTVQHEIRAQTGMDAEIGGLKVALASPTAKLAPMASCASNSPSVVKFSPKSPAPIGRARRRSQ